MNDDFLNVITWHCTEHHLFDLNCHQTNLKPSLVRRYTKEMTDGSNECLRMKDALFTQFVRRWNDFFDVKTE